ncbi:unnamed protein product [Polarella glacialis]|uniref:Uncharacterized protein n=1 Tax=Polarella glacialis TaxID=89957 RepID=A0A813GWU7_POLGL|nr:unnamed protein product [Polarella glacialis]
MKWCICFFLWQLVHSSNPDVVFPPNWMHAARMTTGDGHGPNFEGQNIVCTDELFARVTWMISPPGRDPSPFSFVLNASTTPARFWQIHDNGSCTVEPYDKPFVFNDHWADKKQYNGTVWWRGTLVDVFEGMYLYFGPQNEGTAYIDATTHVIRGFTASKADAGSQFEIEYLPSDKPLNGGGGWTTVPDSRAECREYGQKLSELLNRLGCKRIGETMYTPTVAV